MLQETALLWHERRESTTSTLVASSPKASRPTGPSSPSTSKKFCSIFKYKIDLLRKVTHGQPKKTDKSGSVFYAKNFFAHYSPYPLSASPKGRFTEFCVLFYRAAGGGAIKPGELSWHIRKALKEKKSPDGCRTRKI
jgi:hypothetical protein